MNVYDAQTNNLLPGVPSEDMPHDVVVRAHRNEDGIWEAIPAYFGEVGVLVYVSCGSRG